MVTTCRTPARSATTGDAYPGPSPLQVQSTAPVAGVEGGEGAIAVASHVDDEPPLVDDRRGGRAVQRRGLLELAAELLAPEDPPAGRVEGRQDAADAEGEDPAVLHQRASTSGPLPCDIAAMFMV